jgi:hypothetical protein
VNGQLHVLAALLPVKEPPPPVPIRWEVGWTTELVWKTLPGLELRPLGRSALSLSLYRLRYRGSQIVTIRRMNIGLHINSLYYLYMNEIILFLSRTWKYVRLQTVARKEIHTWISVPCLWYCFLSVKGNFLIKIAFGRTVPLLPRSKSPSTTALWIWVP